MDRHDHHQPQQPQRSGARLLSSLPAHRGQVQHSQHSQAIWQTMTMSPWQPAQRIANNGSLPRTPDFSTAKQHMAGCSAALQPLHLTFPSLDSTASSSVVIWFPDSSTTSRAGSLVSTSGTRVRLLYLRRTTRSCWSSPISAGRSDSLLLQQRGGHVRLAATQNAATCKQHVARLEQHCRTAFHTPGELQLQDSCIVSLGLFHKSWRQHCEGSISAVAGQVSGSLTSKHLAW